MLQIQDMSKLLSYKIEKKKQMEGKRKSHNRRSQIKKHYSEHKNIMNVRKYIVAVLFSWECITLNLFNLHLRLA